MLCCLHLLRLLKLLPVSWTCKTICLLNPWQKLVTNQFVEHLTNVRELVVKCQKKLVTNLFVEPLANVRELVHLQVGKLPHKASPTCTILAYIHHSETESKLEMLCSFS